MSKESHIALSDNFFIGEEKQLKFVIVDAAGVALDVSAFTFAWVLAQEGDTSTLKIEDANISTEVGASVEDTVVVNVDRSDTLSLTPGVYKHTLWRIDNDLEQVLSYGDCYLRRHPDYA